MAIQMRRGVYADFNAAKMVPGEWAIVLSGAEGVVDGQAAYICFAPGKVKRLTSVDDVANIIAGTESELVDRVMAAVQDAADAANRASENADSASAAASAAQEAAEEARGSVMPERKLYLAYDQQDGTDYISIVDTEE